MPIVHIEELAGDGAEMWLAFARQHLRDWDRLFPAAPRFRVFPIGDNGYVRIRQNGKFQYIAVNVGAGTYMEFETSGSPVFTQTVIQDGIEFAGVYKPAVVQVGFDGKTAQTSIRTGKRQLNASMASLIKEGNQIQLIDEPVVERSSGTKRTDTAKLTFKSLLYESWAPNHPYTGIYMRAVNYGVPAAFHYQRGSFDAQGTRDIGFDTPFQTGQGTAAVKEAFLRNAADWPRANGVQIVDSPTFGSREFAIYVDAFDQFFAFPTSQIAAVDASNPFNQNVDPKYVKQATIAWPGWMFRKTQRFLDYFNANSGATDFTGLISFPEYDWKLHPDGTKACAVVFQRQAANFDTTYFSTSLGSSPPTLTTFNTLRDSSLGIVARHSATFDVTNLPQRYCVGNGLIELTLTITLTGANPEDFAFAVSVNEVRNPETTPYCTFLAGYTWFDIPNGSGGYVADRGDLCALDVERYYNASAARPGTDPQAVSFLSLKNLTKATELSSWYGGDNTGQGDASTTVIDYDMASLSFVFGMPLFEKQVRSTFNYFTIHPCAAVVTFNKLQTVLYPDTIPSDRKATLDALVRTNGRDVLSSATWTYLPYNDLRDWTATTPDNLSNLRDYYAVAKNWKSLSPATPPNALLNWFEYGLCAYDFGSGADVLLEIDSPRFGWYAYADEVMNRMAVSPRSTFYVHPNGSWWFFDQHRIYNPYGVPVTPDPTLADFIANAKLEHVIYDAVHLENSVGSLDTSFAALYTAAAAKVTSGGDTFNAVTKDSLRASIVLSAVPDAGHTGGQVLDVAVTWGGATWHYTDPAITDGMGSIAQDGGGLVDLTLGDLFSNGTTFFYPSVANVPVTFSSVVMIT